MDVVIPFVDCSERVWMENILKYGVHAQPHYITKYTRSIKTPIITLDYVRYYDYGTIKYVLRGINKFMPYIKNVFLIVSNIEQVPNYIDQTEVKVILHKDIIPEKYLPIYNSNLIEMFIQNIPGLDEEFVYLHDDMIPISPIKYEDIFKDSLPCIYFESNEESNWEYLPQEYKGSYSVSFYEGENTVNMLIGNCENHSNSVIHPGHGPLPLLKSICMSVASMSRHNLLINGYSSRFRIPKNINISYWGDILYFLNKYIPSNELTKNISILDIDNLVIDNIQKQYTFLCINDSKSVNHPISYVEKVINNKLDYILPDKCKYENDR